MSSQDEYNSILRDIQKICFKVYADNREENKFLKNSAFSIFENLVWFMSTVSIFWVGISEVQEEPISDF